MYDNYHVVTIKDKDGNVLVENVVPSGYDYRWEPPPKSGEYEHCARECRSYEVSFNDLVRDMSAERWELVSVVQQAHTYCWMTFWKRIRINHEERK